MAEKPKTIKFTDENDPRWIAFNTWFSYMKNTSISNVSMPDAVAEAVVIAMKEKKVKG